MCRSDSTRRIIICRWSSLVGLVFYRSSCLPTVNIVAKRLPGRIEPMCRNESFVWRSEYKVFRMHSTGSYSIAIFTHAKHWISLKLHELPALQYIFHMITSQLFMYTEALGDVHAYVNAAIASCNYIEPTPTSSESIIYRQLFDELQSPVY
jgi:hypothetical protein